jgi:RecA-family ATPase
MTITDRITGARAYLAKLPVAVAGQGGHPATYRVASILANGFDLPWDDAWMLLTEFNARCSPPWSEKELRHKLNDAYVKPHERPKGWLVAGKERRVGSNGRFVFDPKRVAELADTQTPFTTADVLLWCFKDDEVVCITNEAGQTEDGKWFPASKGIFLTRAEWIAKFFAPGAVGAGKFGPSESGAWIRINPFAKDDFSGTDGSVSAYRHVLVEFDKKPKDEQVAIFQQSNLPISLLVDSGGKSVHAWVKVDATSKEQWEERRNAVYEYLADHEPDPQNKNPSRWSRLGGVMRGEREQKIVAFGIGAEDWDAFVAWRESQDFPEEISTETLENYDVLNDPNTVIDDENTLVGHGRWLQRGGSLLITAQSGIGKSSFAMQMAMSWACGRELFGIPPKRPLRIGIVQAEGDVGDMAESYQGVFSGMRLKDEEKTLVRSNLRFFNESSKRGKDIIDLTRKIVVRHKLDMVVLDPLMAYIGGNINDNVDCTDFCRGLLEPMLKETGCVAILIHHEGKPKAQEVKDGQTMSDQMYSGIGSSELVNYVRAVINIRRESKDQPVFSFNLTKRGKKAGMRTPDGRSTLSLKLKHADDRVFWEVAPLAGGFELLKVGQQYRHFESKPKISRGAFIEELISDHKLARDQAEALIKALVTNGIMEPRKVGAALYYQGTKYDS